MEPLVIGYDPFPQVFIVAKFSHVKVQIVMILILFNLQIVLAETKVLAVDRTSTAKIFIYSHI